MKRGVRGYVLYWRIQSKSSAERYQDTESLTQSLQPPLSHITFFPSSMKEALWIADYLTCILTVELQKAPWQWREGILFLYLRNFAATAPAGSKTWAQQQFKLTEAWTATTATKSACTHPLANVWLSDRPSPATFISSEQSRWSRTQLWPGMLHQSPADDPIRQLVQPSALLWVCLQWPLFLEIIRFGWYGRAHWKAGCLAAFRFWIFPSELLFPPEFFSRTGEL